MISVYGTLISEGAQVSPPGSTSDRKVFELGPSKMESSERTNTPLYQQRRGTVKDWVKTVIILFLFFPLANVSLPLEGLLNWEGGWRERRHGKGWLTEAQLEVWGRKVTFRSSFTFSHYGASGKPQKAKPRSRPRTKFYRAGNLAFLLLKGATGAPLDRHAHTPFEIKALYAATQGLGVQDCSYRSLPIRYRKYTIMFG